MIKISQCDKCGKTPMSEGLHPASLPKPTLYKEGLGKRGKALHEGCGGNVAVEEIPA